MISIKISNAVENNWRSASTFVDGSMIINQQSGSVAIVLKGYLIFPKEKSVISKGDACDLYREADKGTTVSFINL